MYIPTQEERYSKIARITLLLCVIVPSGVVAWLGQVGDILSCAMGFLWPIALPLTGLGLDTWVALCASAAMQAIIFFAVARSHKLTAKGKVTLCITWGMLFALILRIMIAYEIWLITRGEL